MGVKGRPILYYNTMIARERSQNIKDEEVKVSELCEVKYS